MQMKRKFKELYHEQLLLDAYFLYSQRLMDYSMLVVVGSVRGVSSLTIIDYFQEYNCRKKLEYFFRYIYNPSQKNENSCVSHKKYYKRFVQFITNNILS